MRQLIVLGMVVVTLSISACSSDGEERPDYLDAQQGKPLMLENGKAQAENEYYQIPGIASHQAPSESPDISPPNILGDAKQQQSTPRQSLYPSQLQEDAQGTPYLVVQGNYEELWQVLLQTLKRAGFEIKGADPGRGHIILQVKDISQKKQPVKQVRLMVIRAYQSVRILVQEVEQPTPVAAVLARSILTIIRDSL